MPKLILKRGREKAIKNFHHWIFSGAVKYLDQSVENGGIVEVYSEDNEFLGIAYINRNTSILARMLSFKENSAEEALEENIENAISLRKNFFDEKITNCYRVINSEGDLIPGLIVDKYDDILVIQISTLGIEKLKNTIVEILTKKLKPKFIYEKSDSFSRNEEGLKEQKGTLFGKKQTEILVKENNLNFKIDLINSQKTGFFMDQREMRNFVGTLAKDKKLLNLFSYTGGFSVYAAKNGAEKVDSVDISEPAINLAKENFKLNKLDPENSNKYNFSVADVFDFLRNEKIDHNFIILDPPAFAKKKSDVVQACRGYKDLNRLAIEKIQNEGLLLTCSCSYYVDEKLFQQVVFEAAAEAKRRVHILQKHHHSFDHPLNIFHPEGSYLKSLLLYIN